MTSRLECPHLTCGCCTRPLSLDRYPVQSSVCGHSICKKCVRSVKQDDDSEASGNKSPDQYFDCPICKEPRAFHPRFSKPNLTALSAIDLMDQYAKILRSKVAKSGRGSNTSNPAKRQLETSTPPEVVTTPTLTEDAVSFPSPPASPTMAKSVSEQDSPISFSSAESESSEETLEPASPPPSLAAGGGKEDGRMVWVKFEKGAQLAFLQETRKETAMVVWESGRYEAEVLLERIEEIDLGGNAMSRPKRSRRACFGTKRMDSFVPAEKKTKKLRR